jgi:hypothetical protein
MFKKLLILMLTTSFVCSSTASAEEPSLQDLHNAIRNRDARALSFVLFGADLSFLPLERYYSTDLYSARLDDFNALLEERNSEGESAITLCEAYPSPRVIRVLNFARRIAQAQAPRKTH